MKALILLSGGIDSSCCVAFYRRLGYEVSGVFVDYGQPVNRKEELSAKAIAEHYGIPVDIIRCSGPSADFHGEISGRNAFLVFAALLYIPKFTGLLTLGIHAGTEYYDCTEHFMNGLNTIVSGYRDGGVSLAAPFVSWTKREVYNFCIEHRLPVQLTWSCEVGPSSPCGRCLSCRDREHLNVCTSK